MFEHFFFPVGIIKTSGALILDLRAIVCHQGPKPVSLVCSQSFVASRSRCASYSAARALQENRAISDSRRREAKLDHKPTSPDSTVRARRTNARTRSRKVHDISISPELSVKVVLYSARARTGEHETSQRKQTSVRSSFNSRVFCLFFFSQREKKKVLNNISFSLYNKKKCSLESGLQKLLFFFCQDLLLSCGCLSFVLSQC